MDKLIRYNMTSISSLHNLYLYFYLASVSASHMVDRLAETPLGRENESIKQDMHDVHINIYPCHIFMMYIYCQDMHDVHISPSAIICFTVVLFGFIIIICIYTDTATY